jgi:hypothetical protein
MMLAALTKQPNLILTEEESAKLAAAVNRVVELYDVPLLDDRSRAWIGLSLVGVEVYGTRFAAAIFEAASKRRPQVVPIKQATAPPQANPQPSAQPIDTFEAYAGGTVINGQA